jgi:hypothetical protein
MWEMARDINHDSFGSSSRVGHASQPSDGKGAASD